MQTLRNSALAVFAAMAALQLPAARAADALTLYSSARPGSLAPDAYRHGGRGQAIPGYAVVRHERELPFARGRNTVRFTDVAALIDPTTVTFESLTDAAGTSVVEQNFQFDLVSTEKLLQRYVDRAINVDQVRGNGVESFAGTLLSTAGGITLRRVPCEKTLVYYGAPGHDYGGGPMTDRNYGTPSNRKVDVYLGFRNVEQNNMGMPLPAGRIRVSKADAADGTLEFIGEDAIDHTPRNEKVLIRLGSAFDVVGERRQLNFAVDTSCRTMTEEFEVKVRNQKKEPVTVMVKENLYRWVNWQVTAKTHDFEKQDARTAHFPLKIAAGGETVLRYTVHYSW